MVAILLSTAALVLSILALWGNTLNRRQQRQITISQKRTEVLVAFNEIEMVLKPTMRDVQTLMRTAVPGLPSLQPAFDGMTEILDAVRKYHKKLSDAIAPAQSSHKVLMALEFLLAELKQQVAKARDLSDLVAKAMAETHKESG